MEQTLLISTRNISIISGLGEIQIHATSDAISQWRQCVSRLLLFQTSSLFVVQGKACSPVDFTQEVYCTHRVVASYHTAQSVLAGPLPLFPLSHRICIRGRD